MELELDDGTETVPREQTVAFRTLRELATPIALGEVIGKVASAGWYVEEGSNVLEVADDLALAAEIYAVAVTDAELRVVGVVVRRDFFTLIGRPFGRDVLRHHVIRSVCEPVRTFHFDTNLFVAAEEIDRLGDTTGMQTFALLDRGERFAGLFSSRDLLVYLSNITKRDIELARTIQVRIVREFEQILGTGLEMLCSSYMAKGVGGDFYTSVAWGSSHRLICICDVSGKGVAASLITAVLHGMIHAFDLAQGLLPLIDALNRFVVRTFRQERFLTGIFIDLDERTGLFSACDLGHGHGYVFRGGRLHRLKGDEANLPIGVRESLSPKLYRYRLAGDDLLLLFTDGLFEQTNLQGKTYSLKRIEELARRHARSGLKSLRVRLFEDFHHFRESAPLKDDVTVVLARRLDPAAPSSAEA